MTYEISKEPIPGVVFTPQKRIEDTRGEIRHIIKKTDDSFQGFGEAYFSLIKSEVTKGWKKHRRMCLNLIPIFGAIDVRIVNISDCGHIASFNKFRISIENYGLLTIPPNNWVALTAVSVDSGLVNIANIEHDPSEAETITKLNQFGSMLWEKK